MLAGATVTIGSAAASDSLAVDTTGTGVGAQYDGNSGVLTLTGSASLATYQQLLEHVTYSSSAADPTFGGAQTDRIIIYQVTDGTQPSNGVDVILGFTPVLDLDTVAPGSDYSTTFTVGGSGVPIANANLH